MKNVDSCQSREDKWLSIEGMGARRMHFRMETIIPVAGVKRALMNDVNALRKKLVSKELEEIQLK